MSKSKWVTRFYKESNYMAHFNQANGMFMRYGQDNIDPFCNMAGPELLDIAITNFCEKNCSFCYRQSHNQGKFMSLDDYRLVMEQASQVGVLQVALGGGNPNQHPDFIEILKMTREFDIIPSYTTNGQGLTDKIYQATKKLCGAMAVSWYEPYDTPLALIERANGYKIPTNIHFLLSKTSLPLAIELLEKGTDTLSKINALIFLNYKPIHSPESLCLSEGEEISRFLDLVKNAKVCQIGFDSCMISYLTKLSNDLAHESVDFCEAGRFSGYVSEELNFYPCSFLNDISQNGINLKTTSLTEAWRNGEEFVKIREKLNAPGIQNYPISACLTCQSYSFCHGGCQILNINRCRALPAAS